MKKAFKIHIKLVENIYVLLQPLNYFENLCPKLRKRIAVKANQCGCFDNVFVCLVVGKCTSY